MLYNIIMSNLSNFLTHTYTSIKPSFPVDSSLSTLFPLFHFFADLSPLLSFSIFLLPSCFHLLLSPPLLRSITMSHGTLGQREAEHTRGDVPITPLLSVALHASQPRRATIRNSVAALVSCVGVKKVAGFETINVICVTHELRMVKVWRKKRRK